MLSPAANERLVRIGPSTPAAMLVARSTAHLVSRATFAADLIKW
jgi:hypothetical protein